MAIGFRLRAGRVDLVDSSGRTLESHAAGFDLLPMIEDGTMGFAAAALDGAPDAVRAARTIARKLRPGAELTLHLSAPRWSRRAIREILEGSGFEDVAFRPPFWTATARRRRPCSELEPEIVRTADLDASFAALARPEVKAAVHKRRKLAFAEEVERFNAAAKPVYVVIGGPLSRFQGRLDRYLEQHGLIHTGARHELVERAHALTAAFVSKKSLADGRWDVTITSTLLKNTRRRQWHLDTFDETGATHQLNATFAGWPGLLLSVQRDYDRARFEALRSERRRARDRIERDRIEQAIEALLAEMRGHPFEGDDVVLLKSGEVPHSSPVLARRRLVYTLVEYDDLMTWSP